ncbi:serine/threonine-protein kinase [Dorcoceras hygrometricum]|uniref:Serine/threonine-protein kinase n=1 Tax=Dorcoceras hygrometricum TaxID=472368 RepID=A0A2Z7BNC3_9LAMI|nr:serine/threonine-protein kinase [Dorcoceras hygrometricum]
MKLISSILICLKSSANTLAVKATEDEHVQTISNAKFHVFSFSELETATQGFKNKIGEGGFGSVYKGRLVGGNFVAVKVLSVGCDSMHEERKFLTEINVLSDIRHDNLVTVRGCCIYGAQRLLVYDYMENKSLLHCFLASEEKRATFTWNLRKHISLGIARGICYLHEDLHPHIVHRDIKASNILLDQHFTPKVADFGLAKLFKDNMSHISTRVAGTLGYLSPEYAQSGHLTRKSDVYSFGVLLLQIVSGRPILDYHLQNGEQFLVDKAWELYNGKNLLKLVDSALNKDFPKEEAVQFLKVGLLCVQETARLRPSMSAVLKMLNREIETDHVEISCPGIIGDLKKIKIGQKHSLTSPA